MRQVTAARPAASKGGKKAGARKQKKGFDLSSSSSSSSSSTGGSAEGTSSDDESSDDSSSAPPDADALFAQLTARAAAGTVPKQEKATEAGDKAAAASAKAKRSVVEEADFAGTKVTVTRLVDATRVTGLASTKRRKLTSMQKSRLDWESFKDETGDRSQIEAGAARTGTLDKQEFLDRTDWRQFEQEKAVREVERQRRDAEAAAAGKK